MLLDPSQIKVDITDNQRWKGRKHTRTHTQEVVIFRLCKPALYICYNDYHLLYRDAIKYIFIVEGFLTSSHKQRWDVGQLVQTLLVCGFFSNNIPVYLE